MRAKYTSKDYAPDKVRARYVMRMGDQYLFCEVGDDRRYDLRQGTVNASELPAAVRAAADARAGFQPAYVEWKDAS